MEKKCALSQKHKEKERKCQGINKEKSTLRGRKLSSQCCQGLQVPWDLIKDSCFKCFINPGFSNPIFHLRNRKWDVVPHLRYCLLCCSSCSEKYSTWILQDMWLVCYGRQFSHSYSTTITQILGINYQNLGEYFGPRNELFLHRVTYRGWFIMSHTSYTLQVPVHLASAALQTSINMVANYRYNHIQEKYLVIDYSFQVRKYTIFMKVWSICIRICSDCTCKV